MISRMFANQNRPRVIGKLASTRTAQTEKPVTPKPVTPSTRPPAFVGPKGTDPTTAVELWRAVKETEAGWCREGVVHSLTRKARTRAEFLAMLEDQNYHGLYRALQFTWKVDERDVTDALNNLPDYVV